MPADRFGEPWPDVTYHGFSGPAQPPPRRGLRRPSRGAVAGGLACAAIALGLAAGFAFRPDHRSLSAGDAEAHVRQPVPIEVSRPPPPAPLPRPAGKLEVLNPATAEAARAARPTWTTAPAPAQAPSVHDASAVAPAGSTPQMDAFAPRQALAGPPPAAIAPRIALDACAGSRSRADALVCADPQLAAYDRELNRAYRRAIRSGAVAPDDLRADQRDWLDDRERAARRSPEAIAEAYEARIDELNRIADDGPGDDSY